jgi:predicted transcriptional regulator
MQNRIRTPGEIETYRRALGLSQDRLASLAKVPQSSVSKLERLAPGEIPPAHVLAAEPAVRRTLERLRQGAAS